MTTEPTSTPKAPAETKGRATEPQRPGTSLERRVGNATLASERGTTSISDLVVAKIATFATREIPGVQALGSGFSRTIGSLRAKIPGATSTSTVGVNVEVGERQAAMDIDIIVHYGHSIVDVADAVRSNVIAQVEGMTGLEVVEVNVSVDDLYVDGYDTVAEPRVA